MKPGTSWPGYIGLGLVFLLLLPCIQSLELARRNAAPTVISLDIQRRHIENPAERDRVRRQAPQTVEESLDNEVWAFFLLSANSGLRNHLLGMENN